MIMSRTFFPPSFILAAVMVLAHVTANAQSNFMKGFSLGQSAITLDPIPSNSISHISIEGTTLWAGTSRGLARTTNGGRTWHSFASVPEFARPGIFAVAVTGDTVWASTGFTREVGDQAVQTGAGYTYSLDNGTMWTGLPQALDGASDSIVTYGTHSVWFLPVIVPEQNVTYDIAFSTNTIWIASWASGLRKSTNLGQTWQRIVLPNTQLNTISPTDSLQGYRMNPRDHNNFLAFSVYAQTDSIIWAGTAGGINRSADGGLSWTKFTTQNQLSPILANWIIAIKGQQLGSIHRVWCTNWIAETGEQFGVSYSDDDGRTWKNFLHGIRAYEFAFKDSIAYVATEEGIYRTADAGISWTRSGIIVDRITREVITRPAFFSVGVIGDTIFGGSGDGLVRTIDNSTHPFGESWEIIRTYEPVANRSTTYAYPNPFSPNFGPVRVHYSTGGTDANVTIEVFDFGMNRVRTLIKDAPRSGTREHDEIWNAFDDNGRQVANGVYFYRVVVDGGDPAWGKIMVLQ
jgi:photosystem II stability/assembly factor-like uncharacterized protein